MTIVLDKNKLYKKIDEINDFINHYKNTKISSYDKEKEAFIREITENKHDYEIRNSKYNNDIDVAMHYLLFEGSYTTSLGEFGEEVRNNELFILSIPAVTWIDFNYVKTDLIKDRDFANLYVRLYPHTIYTFIKEFADDKEYVLDLIYSINECDTRIAVGEFDYIPGIDNPKRNYIYKVEEWNTDDYELESQAPVFKLNNLPKNYKTDMDIIKAFMDIGADLESWIKKNAMDNKEFLLSHLRNTKYTHNFILKDISEELKSDKDFILDVFEIYTEKKYMYSGDKNMLKFANVIDKDLWSDEDFIKRLLDRVISDFHSIEFIAMSKKIVAKDKDKYGQSCLLNLWDTKYNYSNFGKNIGKKQMDEKANKKLLKNMEPLINEVTNYILDDVLNPAPGKFVANQMAVMFAAQAIMTNDLERFEDILKKGVDPNTLFINLQGQVAHITTALNDKVDELEFVKLLHKYGYRFGLMIPALDNTLLLSKIVNLGNPEVIKYIINNTDADVNARNIFGNTPLNTYDDEVKANLDRLNNSDAGKELYDLANESLGDEFAIHPRGSKEYDEFDKKHNISSLLKSKGAKVEGNSSKSFYDKFVDVFKTLEDEYIIPNEDELRSKYMDWINIVFASALDKMQ